MTVMMSVFANLLLIGITVGGVLLIVAPSLGRELLANIGKGAGLFVVGMLLLEMSCASLHW